MFVSGVLTELPFFEVEAESTVVLPVVLEPFILALCLAAFSARRFCFEADGAMASSSREL